MVGNPVILLHVMGEATEAREIKQNVNVTRKQAFKLRFKSIPTLSQVQRGAPKEHAILPVAHPAPLLWTRGPSFPLPTRHPSCGQTGRVRSLPQHHHLGQACFWVSGQPF